MASCRNPYAHSTGNVLAESGDTNAWRIITQTILDLDCQSDMTLIASSKGGECYVNPQLFIYLFISTILKWCFQNSFGSLTAHWHLDGQQGFTHSLKNYTRACKPLEYACKHTAFLCIFLPAVLPNPVNLKIEPVIMPLGYMFDSIAFILVTGGSNKWQSTNKDWLESNAVAFVRLGHSDKNWNGALFHVFLLWLPLI